MTDVSNNVKLDIDEIDLSGTQLNAAFPVKLTKRKTLQSQPSIVIGEKINPIYEEFRVVNDPQQHWEDVH